jgi:hypothetical protein
VSVFCDERDRPAALEIGDRARSVEVLGTVVGLASRERGWRVRLDTGVEVTLVREPGGFWYADEAPEARERPRFSGNFLEDSTDGPVLQKSR